MNIAFLSIGTNIGDRENNLRAVLAKIEEYAGRIFMSSSIYETEPWGFNSENEFLNMVVAVETDNTPSGLLGRLLYIESMLGRLRNGKQFSSRIIDIDILLYSDVVFNDSNLKIPHPRLHERKFVLVPLCEIAPEMLHPVFKNSFASLLKACNDMSKVRKFTKIDKPPY